MKVKMVAAIVLMALVVSNYPPHVGWAQDIFEDPAPTGPPVPVSQPTLQDLRSEALEEQKKALDLQTKAFEEQKKMLQQLQIEKEHEIEIKQAADQAGQAMGLADKAAIWALGRYGGGERGEMHRELIAEGKYPPLDIVIRQVAQAIRDAENDEARAAATNQLKEVLDQYFEQDMQVRTKELEGIAARLQKLQQQLDRRREKKQEIIDLQIKLALNEADGLGFYGQPKEGEFNNIRVPAPAINFGGRGYGFGGRGYGTHSGYGMVVRSGTPLTPSPPSAIRPALKLGDMGDLVEALQSTLNDRVRPSPNILVDGDFGPETKSAVERFQSLNELEATGVVDAATWKALDLNPVPTEPTR